VVIRAVKASKSSQRHGGELHGGPQDLTIAPYASGDIVITPIRRFRRGIRERAREGECPCRCRSSRVHLGSALSSLWALDDFIVADFTARALTRERDQHLVAHAK